MGRYSSDQISFSSSNDSNNQWPTTFNKEVVAIDLNGVIVKDTPLRGPDDIEVLPSVLEAIKKIRQKQHKLVVLSDQPCIGKGIISAENIDESFNHLMKIFGEYGIQSIDGFLYNTSSQKEDYFAKPNIGLGKRAEDELLFGSKIKNGWYVGDSLVDLKFADKMGAKPVLINTGDYQNALDKLDLYTYRKLKSKTLVYNSLLDFANSI